MPKVGDYSIVTDWDGNPKCVIETTAVQIMTYSEMTFDICKREGEDDNLESWKQGHQKFFTEEGKERGKRKSPSGGKAPCSLGHQLFLQK